MRKSKDQNTIIKDQSPSRRQEGTVLIALLITAATFTIIIYSLLAILAAQFEFPFRQIAGDQALYIAEAGVNYYRWHLTEAPLDLQDGTGAPGPYLHDYYDPEGNNIGQFSLEITPPEAGSNTVTIKSTGWTTRFPTIKRTVTVTFGPSSYASFMYMGNTTIWFGPGVTINGNIHANIGIRQDGINTSQITSASETYTCGKETGCDPSEEKPGVWGEGEDSSLWEFPVPNTDFSSISFDYGGMRDAAQTDGVYLPPSGNYGYNIIFNADATVTIYNVTDAMGYEGWDPDEGCKNRNEKIQDQVLVGTYNLSDAPIIFVEDTVWVRGTVNGKTTVVSARFPLDTYKTYIWLPDNLVYLDKDGDDVLGLIAQNSIYFARDVPEVFEVDAAMIAQKGHVIRHGFLWFCGEHSNAERLQLTLFGSIMSNKEAYWNFGTKPESGFKERTAVLNFDTQLLTDPPPYYPKLSGFNFTSWIQE